MRAGSKSLLFGAHQIFIHPLIVAYCWWKLYGFPYNPLLWLCFIVHDWGYFGRKDMDGNDGSNHPYFGAGIVHSITGSRAYYFFCLFHSRKMMRHFWQETPSKLCVADKLAIVYTPIWLYNREELVEYMKNECTENVHNWKKIVDLKSKEFVDKYKDTAYGPSDYCTRSFKL